MNTKQSLINACKAETYEHIHNVQHYIQLFTQVLLLRGIGHDRTKLQEPELSIFAENTNKLKHTTYGSDEYKQRLTNMKVALDHHYTNNRHHPEWSYYNGLLKQEEWKDVVGFEGYYQVSNWGRIKTVERVVSRPKNGDLVIKERILKAHKTPKGYYRVQLQANGKRKNILVHRAVAEAFIPNPENKPQVNHKNGIKTDNYVDNLEWVTNGENQLHAYKEGLQKVKYVVHCEELNLTTLGTEEMARKLKELGYENVRESSILACIDENNNCSHHLGLHFTGYLIEEYEPKKPNLISNMNLIDIVEMLCDWKSATLRHSDGDIRRSIEINQERFGYSDELKQIFLNTIELLEQLDLYRIKK